MGKSESEIIDEMLKRYDEIIIKKVGGVKQYIGVQRKLEVKIPIQTPNGREKFLWECENK